MTQDTPPQQQADDTGSSVKPRRLSLTEQKAALEERHKKELAQLNAKIKAEDKRQKVKARKEDTRRKIIAGALALYHMEHNKGSDFEKRLARLLDEYVVKDAERALFGLPTLAPDEAKARLERHTKEKEKDKG